ncbi:Carbohydrate kinase PfkB [Corchorus olitorius]|uniref:Carbohydrate kinase PfkB n=1 Tax=Corchorus olitorius TaxID=93759 RepID=A0A1R3HY96_9ROSI|nr:Carbohydrate kinase PfkB [Corchorus olitorius]
MGAETLVNNGEAQLQLEAKAPVILGLQPLALVDHVARVDESLLDQIPGETGGSIPVEITELEHILSQLKKHIVASADSRCPMKTMAGGSVANTIRGLSSGFGVKCGMIGAYGDDEQGQLFVSNMNISGVNISRLRKKKGHTAQCVCLVDALGNRTMRPCLSNAVKVQGNELTKEDFSGSKWLVMRYGIFNLEVIQESIKIAKKEGLSISLDLASFEMVRNFREPLLQLLESGNIDLCFANEDEAKELLRGEQNTDPEAALEYLSKYCRWAVVTLGPKGSIAKHGKEIVRVPAVGEINAVDATGAGDLFAGGFLYGLVKGLSLEECCKVGSCSGGSVIRSLGGEVTPENWQWMYKQMQIKGLSLPDIRN